MKPRKIVLYVYDSDIQQLDMIRDLTIERQILDIESRNERERVYAISPSKKIRRIVADRPGKVYHDRDSHTYSVWYDGPYYTMAVDAIGNYILDHIAPVIRDSESFLRNLNEKKMAAIRLLENLSD